MHSNRTRWFTAKHQLIQENDMSNEHMKLSQTLEQQLPASSKRFTGQCQRNLSAERQIAKKNGFKKLVDSKDNDNHLTPAKKNVFLSGDRPSPKKNKFKKIANNEDGQQPTPTKKNIFKLIGKKLTNQSSALTPTKETADTIQSKDHRVYKIVLVGDAGVGKSSLLLQLTDQSFASTYLATIGVDFRVKTFEIEGKVIKMQIWDTAGQERFRAITTTYFRGAQGVIVMFDVTHLSTFQNIKAWLGTIDRYGEENVSKILVGNKVDLVQNREVKKTQARVFAEKYDIPYIETSAKTANNLEKTFSALVRDILIKQPDVGHYTPGITLIPSECKKSNCCW